MEFEGKKILVTGGAGFVGTNLVLSLLKKGSKVFILDDLTTGREEFLSKEAEFVRGSVTNSHLVEQLVKEVEIIFHLAARNILLSSKHPKEDYEVNIGGTLNILLAAKKKGIERIVYSSSASIYGNPRYLPLNEEDNPNPLSLYSVSKLAGENYCIAFYEMYGLSTSVVRYSNIYGPYQSPINPYCGVVAKFFQAAKKGFPLEIHGDGEHTRDFTYVEDAVEATLSVALSKKTEGRVYNVATGIEVNINTLAKKITGLYNKELLSRYIDRRDIDNIRRRVLNVEKIRKDIRWIPNITLDEGLQRTKKWFDKLK
ncbi:MAG: NAD-dependent epimerase/dehydratase family protein [bacterium]|nr:NAD-dependent epimerase/dehydratase family protein [bacterium]